MLLEVSVSVITGCNKLFCSTVTGLVCCRSRSGSCRRWHWGCWRTVVTRQVIVQKLSLWRFQSSSFSGWGLHTLRRKTPSECWLLFWRTTTSSALQRGNLATHRTVVITAGTIDVLCRGRRHSIVFVTNPKCRANTTTVSTRLSWTRFARTSMGTFSRGKFLLIIGDQDPLNSLTPSGAHIWYNLLACDFPWNSSNS